MKHMQSLINPCTKLVAVGYASNATGTINDVKSVINWYMQWAHIPLSMPCNTVPHALVDVKALDTDFLACSAYKFFGPHVGLLYGKRSHMERLRAYRVAPCWKRLAREVGNRHQESRRAGSHRSRHRLHCRFRCAIWRCSISHSRRNKLKAAWKVTWQYEQVLI